MEEVDVLVIGAGPSGCIASAYLNKNNVHVKVVEKSKFPRPVVGESFIPRVMDHFDAVGLIPAIEKAGFEKKWGARFIRDQQVCVFDFSEKYTNGWDWTWQVPRAEFDDVVAKEVQKQGVDIEFENEVVDVEFFDDHSSITTVIDNNSNLSKKIKAQFVIDASGFGRVLPKLLDLETPSGLAQHSSIFAHLKDIHRPSGQNGTLITFDIIEEQVWLWVIPFSNGNTSIGVVGPTEYIEALSEKKDPEKALRKVFQKSNYFKKRFNEVDYLFPPVLLKNYSCSVKQLYGKGFALTGNSSEFLDPVFSSGVAFATESGMLAAKLAKREINGETVDWEKEYAEYMRAGINVFATYVKEWYTGNLQKLFFHEPGNPDVKRKICSVLAGYVWDESNPFVKKHDKAITNMAYTLDL